MLKRKLTFPIVAFLTVIVATVLLAFVLENVRRLRKVDDRLLGWDERIIGSAPHLAGSPPNGGRGISGNSLSVPPLPGGDARERLEAAVALALRHAVERALNAGTAAGHPARDAGFADTGWESESPSRSKVNPLNE